MKKLILMILISAMIITACNTTRSNLNDNSPPSTTRIFKVFYRDNIVKVSVEQGVKILGLGEPKIVGTRAIYSVSNQYTPGQELSLNFEGAPKPTKFKLQMSSSGTNASAKKSVADIQNNASKYGFKTVAIPERQNKYSTNQQNPIVKDIFSHTSEGNIYQMYANSISTWGHETVHGIHAELANSGGVGPIGPHNSGFYLSGTGLGVRLPRLRFPKSEIKPYVPAAMQRYSRFNTYLNSSNWEQVPYYIWDEWFAYMAGALIDLKNLQLNLPRNNSEQGKMMGPVEFIPYATAVAMASKGQVESNPEAVALMRYGIELSIAILREARVYQGKVDVQTPLTLLRVFKTDSSCEPMRNYLKKLYGENWYFEIFESLDPSIGN